MCREFCEDSQRKLQNIRTAIVVRGFLDGYLVWCWGGGDGGGGFEGWFGFVGDGSEFVVVNYIQIEIWRVCCVWWFWDVMLLYTFGSHSRIVTHTQHPYKIYCWIDVCCIRYNTMLFSYINEKIGWDAGFGWDLRGWLSADCE